MKICQFTPTFLPKLGGAEYTVHYLAKTLSSFNHKVTVLCPSAPRNGYLINYPVHKLWLFSPLKYATPLLEWNYSLDLLLENLKEKYNIIHSHFLYPCGFASVKVKKISKIPLVCTPHGVDIQIFPEINYGLRLNPTLNVKIINTIQQVDALISINPSITKSLIECGANKENIFEIPNGVDNKKFIRTPVINIRNKYHIDKSKQILLSVGRNHPKKGYIRFLEILPKILKVYSNFIYVIIGRDSTKLLTRIEKLQLQRYVHVIERVSELELINFFRNASIFISPSLIEGLALVYLEALAAGLPIVATKIAAIEKIVIDGKNGFTVSLGSFDDFKEAILHLLTDTEKLKSMGANSRKMAKNYSWDRITKKHLQIYKKLI